MSEGASRALFGERAPASRTVRFAGSACGFDFVLDDGGREALGHFEARFRELGARVATSAEALATP